MDYLPNIGLFDVVLGFMFLILLYFFGFLYKANKINKNPEYRFFLIGLTAKLIGGVGFALFSVYYYKGGDTFVFFNAGKGLANYFSADFRGAMDVMFTSASNLNLHQHNFAPAYNYILKSDDVLSIVKITSVINVFCFNSYFVSSIFFALFSFLGLWFGYSNLSRLYPKCSKYMIGACFFIPTALLWSSGILKDTVTQGCIGWLLYAFSNVFIFKRKVLLSIGIILFGGIVIFLLKPYMLYVLLPCLFIWVQSNFKHIISSSLLRIILKPFIIALLMGMGMFLFQEISASAGKYSAEKIEKTLEGFHSWHTYLSDKRDQSGYTLGEIEFTPLGILKKTPAALNVSLFRPYLWEVRNAPTLLGAIEGLFLFLFFIYLIVKIRFKFLIILFQNKEALFLMLFAIILGVVVGISSYNFGALSRYKIPVVMFFVLSLVIIQHDSERNEELN